MSVLFQAVINTGKLYSLRKTVNAALPSCKCILFRKYSDVPKRFVTFDEVAAQRRAEARRSLVVQVNSESSFNEFYGYCSKYASIHGVHHYKNPNDEHFMLIEFSTEENLKEVLRSCCTHQKDPDVMPVQSPFLWFRAVSGKKEKLSAPTAALVTKDGIIPVNEEVLFQDLSACDTISDQIQMLYDRTTLNDLGVRLRYMVARQLEVIFESLYANIAVRPFGSSVNGFGKIGCDLDLVVTNGLTDESMETDKRLVYQQKRCGGTRGLSQRHAELAAALLELRAAGAARVTRVLAARVPILKYRHDLAALDCDLAFTNTSGVYMSELLWLLGALDARVRALAAAARRWAAAAGLTSAHPGRWITNFPLTLMVIFFLQQQGRAGAVLPTLDYLKEKAGKEDTRIAEDNIDCTFLRDLNKLPADSYGQNKSSLETLLLQFFEFYSQFDFHNKAISINEGRAIRKPNNLPLYIVNPLDQTLNVSRNVSFEECERLKAEVRNAAWQLESFDGTKGDEWGILSLIEKKSSRSLKKLLRAGNSHRLVSMKDLFDDKEDKVENGFRSKLKRMTEKKEGVEASEQVKEDVKEQRKFKNSSIASEVFRIRRDKMV